MTLTELTEVKTGTVVRNTSGSRRRVVAVGPKTAVYQDMSTGERSRILVDSLRRWSQR